MSRPSVGIGVPLVVRFGPADVGRRVTLRRTLPDPTPGGPALGDVVGVLERWSNGLLTLRRRTGERVEVPVATVLAGRVVAPEVSAADLARRADECWRAGEVEALGEWRLRAHGGVTHRPNSVLAVGDPGVATAEAAVRVRRWYAERGLPASIMTPLPAPVADDLRALGWSEEHRSLVMSAPLADIEGPAAPADLDVRITDTLPADWADLLAPLAEPDTSARFTALLRGSPSTSFVTVRDSGGAPLAVARGAISERWVNVTNVEVAPSARRRGLGATVVGAVLEQARDSGATHAFLQLWPTNTPALRLYTRLGFTPHHEYGYLVAPTD